MSLCLLAMTGMAEQDRRIAEFDVTDPAGGEDQGQSSCARERDLDAADPFSQKVNTESPSGLLSQLRLVNVAQVSGAELHKLVAVDLTQQECCGDRAARPSRSCGLCDLDGNVWYRPLWFYLDNVVIFCHQAASLLSHRSTAFYIQHASRQTHDLVHHHGLLHRMLALPVGAEGAVSV